MRDILNEEQRQQNREMDVESLAKVVFRHLKENLDLDPDDPDYSSVERLIRDLFPEEDYPPPSNYPKNLFEKEKPTQKLMFMLNHWSSKILPERKG